jgi:uncharacterized membrane protein
MMWDGYYGHGAGWEGWVMLMFMIIFAAAAIVAVVYFVRYFAQPQAAQPQQAQFVAPSGVSPAPESPQDILKRRYACGEIEREEYLQKLGDL